MANRNRLRSGWPLWLAVLVLVLIACLLALGTWQVQRLRWKLDLIERTSQRVHAPVVALPPRSVWSDVSPERYEYLHVVVDGVWIDARSSWVQASTELGAGFWLLTPLRQSSGDIVMINRGFVPTALRSLTEAQLQSDASGTRTVSIVGLLRMMEPGGAFLRHNDPASQRWYSRDIVAMAAAQHLQNVAPYFVDADATTPSLLASEGESYPVGGLTVIAFHNNHLVYAITWYSLALMLAGACWWIGTDRHRRSKHDMDTELPYASSHGDHNQPP